MSCACENKRLGGEYERNKRLAKKLAIMEHKTVVLYRNNNGMYGFAVLPSEIKENIIEYISPF